MSYRIPQVGQAVVFIDVSGIIQNRFVDKVINIGAGVIELDTDNRLARYVDPAGATAFECMTWHYPDDDISRIGQVVPLSEPQNVPEYAKRIVRRRTGG